jgi:hypothetical protein
MKKGRSWFGRCLLGMALLVLAVSCTGTDTDMKRLTIEPGKIPDLCLEMASCGDQNTFFKVAWLGVNPTAEPYQLDGWATHVLPVPDGYLVLGNEISMETDYGSGNASLFAMKLAAGGAIAWQRQYAPAFFLNILIGAAEDRGGAVMAVTEMMPDEEMRTQDDILFVKIDARRRHDPGGSAVRSDRPGGRAQARRAGESRLAEGHLRRGPGARLPRCGG